MPVQSIDLSAVTGTTFNGSAVDAINLNGTEVWSGSSALKWFIRLPTGTTKTNNDIYYTGWDVFKINHKYQDQGPYGGQAWKGIYGVYREIAQDGSNSYLEAGIDEVTSAAFPPNAQAIFPSNGFSLKFYSGHNNGEYPMWGLTYPSTLIQGTDVIQNNVTIQVLRHGISSTWVDKGVLQSNGAIITNDVIDGRTNPAPFWPALTQERPTHASNLRFEYGGLSGGDNQTATGNTYGGRLETPDFGCELSCEIAQQQTSYISTAPMYIESSIPAGIGKITQLDNEGNLIDSVIETLLHIDGVTASYGVTAQPSKDIWYKITTSNNTMTVDYYLALDGATPVPLQTVDVWNPASGWAGGPTIKEGLTIAGFFPEGS